MKILSLNGGGSLGYITIDILNKLENETGKKIVDRFDLISGVSTGSIIGYALSCGISTEEIKQKYLEFIPKIFKDKKGFIRSIFRNLYKSENLENVLSNYFSNKKISETHIKFMTYACRLKHPATRPHFWKSWKASGEIEAYKAICASCSAPLYFDPYEIDGEYFTDGGIVSNSCNVASIVEARKLGYSLDNISMINFGYLTYHSFDKKDLVGMIKVASNATSMSIGGSEYMEDHQAKSMLDDGNYLGLFPNCLGLSLDSIDLDKMNNISQDFWERNKNEIVSSFLKG